MFSSSPNVLRYIGFSNFTAKLKDSWSFVKAYWRINSDDIPSIGLYLDFSKNSKICEMYFDVNVSSNVYFVFSLKMCLSSWAIIMHPVDWIIGSLTLREEKINFSMNLSLIIFSVYSFDCLIDCKIILRIETLTIWFPSSSNWNTFTNNVIQSISNNELMMSCLIHSNIVEYSLKSSTIWDADRFHGNVVMSPENGCIKALKTWMMYLMVGLV